MVELAVHQVSLLERTNFNLLRNPFSAFSGNPTLFKPICKLKSVVFDLISLLIGFIWIKGFYETRFSKQKPEAINS